MKTTTIASQIEELLVQRQRHTDALAEINRILGGVASMIGGNGHKPGRAATSPVTETAPTKRRRGRRKFDQTAEELVLAFLKRHPNAITREVNAAWKEAGRSFTADVTLGKLVKERKLKRTPLVGERGSRYVLA